MIGDSNPQEPAPTSTQSRFPGDWTAKGEAASGQSPSHALHDAVAHLGELREYASYFAAARLDGIKLSIRKAGLYAVLGIFTLFAAAGLIVVSVVLLCVGLAGAIGAAFQARWMGDVIVGGGLLLIIGLGLVRVRGMVMRGWQRGTVRKYEARKHEQQARFGHDVHERSQSGQ
jgi:hypothetical protein